MNVANRRVSLLSIHDKVFGNIQIVMVQIKVDKIKRGTGWVWYRKGFVDQIFNKKMRKYCGHERERYALHL